MTPAYQLAAIARSISGFGEMDWWNVAGLIGWTVLLGALAALAYRRSGRKVG